MLARKRKRRRWRSPKTRLCGEERRRKKEEKAPGESTVKGNERNHVYRKRIKTCSTKFLFQRTHVSASNRSSGSSNRTPKR